MITPQQAVAWLKSQAEPVAYVYGSRSPNYCVFGACNHFWHLSTQRMPSADNIQKQLQYLGVPPEIALIACTRIPVCNDEGDFDAAWDWLSWALEHADPVRWAEVCKQHPIEGHTCLVPPEYGGIISTELMALQRHLEFSEALARYQYTEPADPLLWELLRERPHPVPAIEVIDALPAEQCRDHVAGTV